MTAFECKVHELQGGVLACYCLHNALVARRRLEVVVRFDRLGDAFLFCSDCALELGDALTAEEGTAGNDVANIWYAEKLQFECVKCLNERLAAVGRELLDTERARLSAGG